MKLIVSIILYCKLDKFPHYFFVGSPKSKDGSTSVFGLRASDLLFNYATIYLILSIVVLLLNSCVYNKEDKMFLPAPENIEEITYTNYTKNIIQLNCLTCHVPGYNGDGTPAGNRNLTTYLGVKQVVDEGHFKAHVIDGIAPTMPYGLPELSQEIKDTLTLWINQGAKE